MSLNLLDKVNQAFGRIKELEAENADLEAKLEAAIEFVEMAGYADNSGGEYPPTCEECGGVIHLHKEKCRLNAWLAAAQKKQE